MKKLVLLLGWMLAVALGAGWGQVTSERVRVLYPDPGLAAYAEQLAREAEAALDVLEPLFGAREGPVVLRINDTVDFFNAYATTLPRRTVELLAPVPAGAVVDLRSPSVTYLLLVHELTHTRQLSFHERPDGRPPLRLGLVTERSAPMPPAWFVEGLATFMESRFTPGGRLDWAFTQGLINALLEEGRFPDLAEMSLYTYDAWPRGLTRYLLGVRFVHDLIERRGWDAVLNALRAYNTGLVAPPSFAEAWERANGRPLEAEWRDWVEGERRRAAAYAEAAQPRGDRVASGRDPVLSPDGRRLAFVRRSGVWVAARDGSGARRLARVKPQRLWWADADTLIYSRYFREGDGVASDVFALDATTGRETRLTRGRHARLAAPAPDGCVYFVRDRAGEAASLQRWCGGRPQEVWRAPEGEHPVGLAISPGGRVALAVAHGGVVDLALLEAGRLRYLAAGRLGVEPPARPPDPCAGAGAELGTGYRRDRYQHLRPTWDGEEALLFLGDEGGVFDLYRLELGDGRVTRLSATLGGVLGAAAQQGAYLAAELDGRGYGIYPLAPLDEPVGPAAPDAAPGGGGPCSAGMPADWRPPERRLERAPYRPWSSLKPYGWLPTGLAPAPNPPYLGLELSLYGLDDTGVYGYRAALGYDPALTGTPYGAYAYLEAGAGAGVDLVGRTAPLGFTIRGGAWPSRGEVVFGVVPGLASRGFWDRWNWRARLEAGPVWSAASGWRLSYGGFVRAGREGRDPWGYLTGGGYGGVYGGPGSAWGLAGAAWKWGGGNLALEARLAGGAGTPLPLGPGVVGDAVALEARLRYWTRPRWRTGDGWLALERLTFAPAAHGRYDPAAGALGYGADLGVYADAVLFYALPLPLGLRGGWDGGWWWRLELGPW
ncbi:hypothetical protein [Oceanithermus desulfurans]